jgi:TRAP-type C4-dicarboxylate transport system permease small subunit
MLRRALDALYLGAGRLAACFLAGIALTIIAQVGGRLAGFVIDSTETAGFCLAASTFLGLAHTFRSGGHIRVNLLIRGAKGRLRQAIELWCVGLSVVGVAFATWQALDFVYFSWAFNEISPGLMAVPFWIPRAGMALGLLILTIALADEFVQILLGAEPSYEANAETILPEVRDEAGSGARPEPGREAVA